MYALLTRIDRWYVVTLQPGLFGDLILLRAWGSRPAWRMTVDLQAVESLAEGEMVAGEIIRRQIEAGYEIVEEFRNGHT